MKRLFALLLAANLAGCASTGGVGLAPAASPGGTMLASTGLIALAIASRDVLALPYGLLGVAGLMAGARAAETGVAGGPNDEAYQASLRAAEVRATWPQNQYRVLR